MKTALIRTGSNSTMARQRGGSLRLVPDGRPGQSNAWRFSARRANAAQTATCWCGLGQGSHESHRPSHQFANSGRTGDIWGWSCRWPHCRFVFSPYPAQQTDASYGRDQQDPSVVGFYAAPTPNAPNATAARGGFASDVTFSQPSGTFDTPFNLTLSTCPLTPSSTMSSSRPWRRRPTSHNQFAGLFRPHSIAATTQVRARAFEPGLFPSTPASESYIQISSNCGTSVPISHAHRA